MIEMAERAAEVDQMKGIFFENSSPILTWIHIYTHISGSTLEEISAMVEQIGREFRSKQTQLQPLLSELKVFHYIQTYIHSHEAVFTSFVVVVKSVRQEYSDVDAIYQERKSSYDKVLLTCTHKYIHTYKYIHTFLYILRLLLDWRWRNKCLRRSAMSVR